MQDRKITEYHVQVQIRPRGRFTTCGTYDKAGNHQLAIYASKEAAERRLAEEQARPMPAALAKMPTFKYRIKTVTAPEASGATPAKLSPDFEVGNIYAIGGGDRAQVESAAWEAFVADERAMLAWPGRDAAIEEIGGDAERRRAMLGWQDLSIAQYLIGVRLERELGDAMDDCELAVRATAPSIERRNAAPFPPAPTQIEIIEAEDEAGVAITPLAMMAGLRREGLHLWSGRAAALVEIDDGQVQDADELAGASDGCIASYLILTRCDRCEGLPDLASVEARV